MSKFSLQIDHSEVFNGTLSEWRSKWAKPVPGEDEIRWSWDWSSYGFRTAESVKAGYKKAVGSFPFDTRQVMVAEEAYCGFTPESWSQASRSDFITSLNTRSLIRLLTSLS